MKNFALIFAGAAALLLATTGFSFQQDADLNAKDRDGQTALMKAATSGNSDSVKALIAAGADANAKDRDGETALMKAATSGNSDSVKALITAGADVNAKDRKNQTALDKATAAKHSEVIKLLKIENETRQPATLKVVSYCVPLNNGTSIRCNGTGFVSKAAGGGGAVLHAIDGNSKNGKTGGVWGVGDKTPINAGRRVLTMSMHWNNGALASQPQWADSEHVDISFTAESGHSYQLAILVGSLPAPFNPPPSKWQPLLLDVTDKKGFTLVPIETK